MAAFEVIALDTATPQLRAPGASDTYTFPRAVEMPLGTANGVLFLNGSKVVTSGSGLTFDSSGNLGLGVTPSAWSGVQGVLEIKGNAYIYSTTGVLSSGANAFFNGTNWIYKTTQAATRYEQVNGVHRWGNAASGTAGNVISFTQAMTLDASGNLGVGVTSPRAQTEIARSSAPTSVAIANSYLQLGGSESGVNSYRLITFGGVGETQAPAYVGYIQTSTTASTLGDLVFGTRVTTTNVAATERARIKSTGQVRFVPLAADPAGAEAGDVYYNSGTNKLRVYNGTTWVDLH